MEVAFKKSENSQQSFHTYTIFTACTSGKQKVGVCMYGLEFNCTPPTFKASWNVDLTYQLIKQLIQMQLCRLMNNRRALNQQTYSKLFPRLLMDTYHHMCTQAVSFQCLLHVYILDLHLSHIPSTKV